MAEINLFWNGENTAGTGGFENGIHEVGGSIPPGSTNQIKELIDRTDENKSQKVAD